uniref:F-box domain-containing protein n=1 Tax=Triticum urartu TaxID=4572 RepID=A0A8R7QBL6_TRIUA
MASWSELPEDLLALVFASIFFPLERACFEAVCHSWRSAVRPPARKLPWIVLPKGAFMTPSDRTLHLIDSY